MSHYVLVLDMLNYKCDRFLLTPWFGVIALKYKVIIATVVC